MVCAAEERRIVVFVCREETREKEKKKDKTVIDGRVYLFALSALSALSALPAPSPRTRFASGQ